MRALLIAASAAALLIPASVGDSAPTAAARVDAKACAARFGEVRKVCKSQFEICLLRFDDGGKPCTDGSQCQAGRCVHQGEDVTPGAKVEGNCDLNNDPCGCRNTVEGGKTRGTMCTD